MYIYIIIDKNTVDSLYYMSTYICVSTVFHKIAKPDCLSVFHLVYISLKKMSENLVLSTWFSRFYADIYPSSLIKEYTVISNLTQNLQQ